ncbi:MAG: hypothetical protein WB951_01685 [Candidatus Sulfotelmatobacter sp.]
MIVVPASLRSDFIHMAGMTIHIALESTIHIVGIRSVRDTSLAYLLLPRSIDPFFVSSVVSYQPEISAE